MAEYIPDFDYGGEVAEQVNNIKVWPTSGKRVALVDADLLPYRIGFVVDDQQYLAAVNLVEEGHFCSIDDTPQFKASFNELCGLLNRWIEEAGCDSAILYCTDSSSNFRLNIAYTDEYKGQRKLTEKPHFFEELKGAMIAQLGCIVSTGVEADDDLSIKAHSLFNDTFFGTQIELGSAQHHEFCPSVTCSSDKDSKITPTWHYNPDTGKMEFTTVIGNLIPKFKNDMIKKWEVVGTGEFWLRGKNAGLEKTKRVCTGETPSTAITELKGSGLKFFYSQLIVGDVSDNYKGLKGKGCRPAYDLLDCCSSEEELYKETLSLYKSHYGDGVHWCPIYKGTTEYRDTFFSLNGCNPPDWDFWEGKGAYLTAYDRMLEQGRLAWMQTYKGDIWRKGKGRIISPNDKGFWHDREDTDKGD